MWYVSSNYTKMVVTRWWPLASLCWRNRNSISNLVKTLPLFLIALFISGVFLPIFSPMTVSLWSVSHQTTNDWFDAKRGWGFSRLFRSVLTNRKWCHHYFAMKRASGEVQLVTLTNHKRFLSIPEMTTLPRLIHARWEGFLKSLSRLTIDIK